jgi:hypothetical protein
VDPETIDGGGGLRYGAIISLIDGINCSPKVVLACRSVNLFFSSEVLDNYESNVSNDRKREVLISSNLTVLIINMNSTYRLICSLSQK